MSTKVQNLYKQLIENNKYHHVGWYKEYKSFSQDIKKIKENLKTHDIRDIETYQGTSFKNSNNAYDDFIKRLIYDKSNGIASRGQSILSWENLNKFKAAQGFDDVIKAIITNPNFETYKDLRKWWSSQNVGNNPVLVNRVVAACTTSVSSTVDESRFHQTFEWLQKQDIIPTYDASEPQDWYHKNIFALERVTEGLTGMDDVDEYWISIFLWEIHYNISNPFRFKKQVIKYGAPGTGKTYTAKRTTKLLFEIWKEEYDISNAFNYYDHIETIQFHPSCTYEDFMEGLRPVLDKNNQAQLSLQNGVFKSFCLNAGQWECDIAKLRDENKIVKEWKDLLIQDLDDIKTDLSGDYWKCIFEIEDKTKKVSEVIPPYFFIIDEINRAELSRVFGELMFCLEYRGIEGAIKTQYAHLNNDENGMIKIGKSYQFFIPTNVYLIGTMNTIDRSVESFDFALRRRFSWEEVMPNIGLLRYHLISHNRKWQELAENLEKLNSQIAIEPLLGRDFQIGHAYLWNLPYSKVLSIEEVRKAVWQDNIAPLLQEYLRGTGKEGLILNFKTTFGLTNG